jgi:DNA-binding beta-propeller fold protein YncE
MVCFQAPEGGGAVSGNAGSGGMGGEGGRHDTGGTGAGNTVRCTPLGECSPPDACHTATCMQGNCTSSVNVGAACSNSVPGCCDGGCVDLETDPSNCGVCLNSCAKGTCQDGVCRYQTLTHVTDACAIAIDQGGHIYWAQSSTGNIYKLSPGSSSSTTFVSGAMVAGSCGGIAVDPMNVYWTSQNGQNGRVLKASPSGMPLTSPFLPSPFAYQSGIAVNAQNIFWTDFNGGTVSWMPLGVDSGTSTQIAWGAQQPSGIALALDSTVVYWTDEGSDQIMKAPLLPTQGPPVRLATSMFHNPRGIAVDATNVYWVTESSVESAPIGGGKPTVLATRGAPGKVLQGIAVDNTSVYWIADMGTNSNGTTINEAILQIPK